MNVIVLEPAQLELDEAIVYYNDCHPGLGDEFLAEVLRTINLIKQYPNTWYKLSSRIRRCLVKRFPYGVVYAASDDCVIIVAVAHLHRKPNYWLDRV